MRKAAILLAITLISLPAISQGKKYQKGMQAAIKEMNKANTPEAWVKCAASFEEFAEAHPDQWIPLYYASYMHIIVNFEEEDPAVKDKHLEKAIALLNKARELAPEQSELQTLQAFYFIGMMSVDPETRGPEYYQDVAWTLSNARETDPKNPRAAYLDAVMTLNMPDFLGGGPEPAKPMFLEAQKLFEGFQNDDPLWPSWGADLVAEELKNLEELLQE